MQVARGAGALARRSLHASARAGAFAIRQPLPAWKADALLPDGSFAPLSNAWHAGKWAVIIFYPVRDGELAAAEPPMEDIMHHHCSSRAPARPALRCAAQLYHCLPDGARRLQRPRARV